MPQQVRSYLDIDLANPYKGLDGATYADWAQAFGGLFPDPRPTFSPDHGPVPFDQLVTPAVRNIDDEGKVSVVITSFRPGVELLTAVRSIVNQSWSNLEILLVDDGSPSEYGSILDQCVTLDARVKLIRLDANVGTYMARNVAMDAATGDFVTFQDSDDWSHPKRIEEQVRLLLQDKTLMATVSEALKVTEHLSITKPGRNPRVMCTSSMMFRRRSTLAKIGYMDSVRKSADTEYLRRIEVAFTLRSVHRIRDSIYALIRQHNSSLSACEFREGWIHPARFAYRSAYTLWHEQIAAGCADPYLPKDLRRRPFPAPSHIRQAGAELTTKSRYDVILASDWRPFGGPQKSMLEEIAALTRQGMRVGVLNIEAYRFMTHAEEVTLSADSGADQRWHCGPCAPFRRGGDVAARRKVSAGAPVSRCDTEPDQGESPADSGQSGPLGARRYRSQICAGYVHDERSKDVLGRARMVSARAKRS